MRALQGGAFFFSRASNSLNHGERTAFWFLLLVGVALLCPVQTRGSSGEALWDDSFRVFLTRMGDVRTVIAQPDDKVLIQGEFQWVGLIPRNGIARLEPNGTLDASFDPGQYIAGKPMALARLPDGRILVGAQLAWNQLQLFRFHADGTPDTSFDNSPGFELGSYASYGLEMDILPLANDSVLVGGFFHAFGATPRTGIARLLPDGSLDPGFDPGTALDRFTAARRLALDDRGEYLVMVHRQGSSPSFLRFGTNGVLSTNSTFNVDEQQRLQLPVFADGRRIVPGESELSLLSANGNVQKVWKTTAFDVPVFGRRYASLDSKGNLLVTGRGPDLPDGKVNFGVIRLLRKDGMDSTFAMPGGISMPNLGIEQIVAQPNGTIVVRGRFNLVNGQRPPGLARLSPDGNLDSTFSVPESYFSSPFGLAPGGEVYTESSTGEAFLAELVRINTNGVQDPNFSFVLYYEQIRDVAVHPRAGVLFSSYFGSPWPCHLFSLVNATNGSSQGGFRISVASRTETGIYSPGTLSHILPHPLDDTTYLVGTFNEINGTQTPPVVRLLRDGTPDSTFAFASPDLLLDDAECGAYVAPDGTLELFAVKNNYGISPNTGHLLALNEDGSLARKVFVPGPLPQSSSGMFRCSDRSWIVIWRTSLDSDQLTLERIGPDGRLWSWRNAPVEGADQEIATFMDSHDRLLIGAPRMRTTTGPFSGLLRVPNRATLPISIHASSSPLEVTLAIQGPAPATVRVESSPDLSTWSPWCDVELEGDEALITIPLDGNGPRLFYRAVLAEDAHPRLWKN